VALKGALYGDGEVLIHRILEEYRQDFPGTIRPKSAERPY
jgi:hypothetical protein